MDEEVGCGNGFLGFREWVDKEIEKNPLSSTLSKKLELLNMWFCFLLKFSKMKRTFDNALGETILVCVFFHTNTHMNQYYIYYILGLLPS